MTEVHHHRPTLKQQNKRFKSKHATKSSLRDAGKGRTPRRSVKSTSTPSAAAQSRLNRRNNAKQSQVKKRQSLVSATRIFSGVDGAPRIVAVIPLTSDVSPRGAVSSLAEPLDIEAGDCPETGIWRLRAERFKTSLQFVNVGYRSMYAALDACKAADYVLFLLSSTVEVDDWGDTLLRTLQAQGLPQVVTAVAPNPSLDSRDRADVQKSLLSFIRYFVPGQNRVFDLHVSSDRLNALRTLSEGKPDDVRWREGRTWILGEKVEWREGMLAVTGVVRGAQLSANRLIHLADYGDFPISKITSALLPRHSKIKDVADMEVEPMVLAERHPSDADSLVSTNVPDDLANEQTWPTEEEMQGGNHDGASAVPDAQKGTTPKRVKRIPKGWSEYQAAWIIDDESEGEEGEGEESSDDAGDDSVEEGGEDNGGQEEPEDMQDLVMDDQDMDQDTRRSVAFQDLDAEEESKQLEDWRNRDREEESQLTFPDEIDTPKDITARTRFQRYRGLRSFRTSPWDPYENLPRDYARIFQFEDFRRTERNIRRRAEREEGIEIGSRVTVYIQGVPEEAARDSASPVILFALLHHEHKVSVLNFTVQRNTEYVGSVRSKDPLILCVGPRRLRVNPVYSQHTRGGGKGPNNVHKFERFLRHGVTSVATTYAPIMFGKHSCLLLRETSDPQAPGLVATGTFLNTDTTRINAKRIILTGHPFKVHKKTATVRYMFFDRDDIQYFKPIALHTKYGRTGHIREPLGTHGYFKAHFDGPVNQMDTVCMSLYKRVFPKWATLWRQPQMLIADSMEE